MVCCALTPAVGSAETIKPVKDSKGEIAGAMFNRARCGQGKKDGNATTDVVTFTSANDSAFQTGMFRSGPAQRK